MVSYKLNQPTMFIFANQLIMINFINQPTKFIFMNLPIMFLDLYSSLFWN